MSPQMSLAYEPSYAGKQSWTHQLEAIRLAVAHLGLKEVCFELDVSGSAVSDALNERDRKRWAAEWTHVVKAMLVKRGDTMALELLANILRASLEGTHFVLDVEHQLTAEEILERLKRDDRGREAIARVLEVSRR